MPLLNIPSSGLRLRPEFTALCEHGNLSTSSLLTLDDFPARSGPLDNIRWILVDHNKLQGELGEKYSSLVHGVIDHHDEENAVVSETEPEPRIVEKCGSCTSLVVRYFRPSWEGIVSSSLSSGAAHAQGEAIINDTAVTQAWDAQIAKMAIASILIDTANLKAPGKVENVDEEAVNYLEAKIQMSPKHAKSWDREQYYQNIDEAKRDLDALTFSQILMKDYKQWTEKGFNLGISSVVKPLRYLVEKADMDSNGPRCESELMQFMEERSLCIFAIMTTSTTADGKFRRELLLQAKDAGHEALRDFAERAQPVFRLEEIHFKTLPADTENTSGQLWRKVWRQNDISKSRKQVAPILRESMRLKFIQSPS